MLYIVSTPIGNLGDISSRVLEILKKVDLILCEDTRVTKKLLSYYQISKPTTSYHQHSKLRKLEYILEQIKKGRKLALVSDAGTPSISDPGAKLVEYLVEKLPDLEIVSIPGPSAVTAALGLSGFSADRFIFLGFPPAKRKRKKFFQEVEKSKYTVVLYESPHRIIKTLNELKEVLNSERKVVLCRELTKKFETVYRGNTEEVINQINQDKIKGEFVLVIRGKK